MKKRRPRPEVPTTKAEALARLARLERRVRALERELAASARRADDAMRENEEGRRALTEALDQQTATAEILGVISRSPTDIQPVLDTVAESAARLCEAVDVAIFRLDGDQLVLIKDHGAIPTGRIGEFTVSLSRSTVLGRSVLDARPVHVTDIQAKAEEFPEGSEIARRMGYRSILGVPLMRDEVAIGAIAVVRAEARIFTDRQVALLQTFADQAVIAMENVRLFKELEARNRDLGEALERQTATAEILRVISSSPTDMQPVMDAVAENAARVCGAADALIFQVEGDEQRRVAHFGSLEVIVAHVRPISRATLAGRAILERRTIHVDDIVPLLDTEYPLVPKSAAIALGTRTHLAAPLMREGAPIGAIVIRRTVMQPFTDKQIELLQTFADQAVIAIENVRLFKELEARNAELTEALEQQTATAEILRVISGATTDAQPVFEAIARSATRLTGGLFGSVFRFDGELIHIVAQHNYPEAAIEFTRRSFPTRPTRQVFAARAILERAVVNVPDVSQDQETRQQLRRARSRRGGRVPERPLGPHAAGGQSGRCDHGVPGHRGTVFRQAGRAPRDLRRSGGDRDRERAPVQGASGAQRGAPGVPGAADGDGGDPAAHRHLADRRPAGLRGDRPQRGEGPRRPRLRGVRRRGRHDPRGGHPRLAARASRAFPDGVPRAAQRPADISSRPSARASFTWRTSSTTPTRRRTTARPRGWAAIAPASWRR